MPKVTLHIERTQYFEREFDVPEHMITGVWPDEELTEEGWDFVRANTVLDGDPDDDYIEYGQELVQRHS